MRTKMMRCDAEAGCCGFPQLPFGHPRPMSGSHPSATSENNFPEHPETPAPSTNTRHKCTTPVKMYQMSAGRACELNFLFFC